jgi:hypothetical protein
VFPEQIRMALIPMKVENYHKVMGVNFPLQLEIMRNQNDPRLGQLISRYSMFGDFDTYWEGFMRMENIEHALNATNMRMKKKHTIIPPWPYRLTQRSTKEEVEISAASSLGGWERYVEIERAE